MIEQIIAALVAQGYKVNTRPFELNILGVRNNNNTPNVFDDTISLLFRDDKGNWQAKTFHATTDPGTYWLNNPINPQGTAILKAGQYADAYMIGLHRNTYTALVQRRPVTVIRDPDRNGIANFTGKEDTGMFGINIHRAMQQGTTKFIDKFSAGCQVLANAADFDVFMGFCQKHKQLYGNSFTYTLVDQSHLFNLPA